MTRKAQITGILDEYTTPSGERVIERWLPHGVYQRGKGDFVEVKYASLSWYNPETMRFWGFGVQYEWLHGVSVWHVSHGSASYHPESRDDRGPWFTDVAEGYAEIDTPGDRPVTLVALASQLPLQLALIATEMFPRFRQLELKMPTSPRRMWRRTRR